MPLQQLKNTELQKCLAAVQVNVVACCHIRDRLEEIADEETVRADETEVMEQQRLSGELLLTYHDLIDAGQAWYVRGKLMDKAEDLQKLEPMSGTYASNPSSASSKNMKSSGNHQELFSASQVAGDQERTEPYSKKTLRPYGQGFNHSCFSG